MITNKLTSHAELSQLLSK